MNKTHHYLLLLLLSSSTLLALSDRTHCLLAGATLTGLGVKEFYSTIKDAKQLHSDYTKIKNSNNPAKEKLSKRAYKRYILNYIDIAALGTVTLLGSAALYRGITNTTPNDTALLKTGVGSLGFTAAFYFKESYLAGSDARTRLSQLRKQNNIKNPLIASKRRAMCADSLASSAFWAMLATTHVAAAHYIIDECI